MEDCRVFLEEAHEKGFLSLDDDRKSIPGTITPSLMESFLRSIMKKLSLEASSPSMTNAVCADQIDAIWRESLLHHFFEPNSSKIHYSPMALVKIELLEKKVRQAHRSKFKESL